MLVQLRLRLFLGRRSGELCSIVATTYRPGKGRGQPPCESSSDRTRHGWRKRPVRKLRSPHSLAPQSPRASSTSLVTWSWRYHKVRNGIRDGSNSTLILVENPTNGSEKIDEAGRWFAVPPQWSWHDWVLVPISRTAGTPSTRHSGIRALPYACNVQRRHRNFSSRETSRRSMGARARATFRAQFLPRRSACLDQIMQHLSMRSPATRAASGGLQDAQRHHGTTQAPPASHRARRGAGCPWSG